MQQIIDAKVEYANIKNIRTCNFYKYKNKYFKSKYLSKLPSI